MEAQLISKTPAELKKRSHRIWLIYWGVVTGTLLLIPALFISDFNAYLQAILASILLGACAYPIARYFAQNEKGIPAISILCMAYALQFALPIFTREATMELMNAEIVYLNESDVIVTLVFTIIGVCALQLGYYGAKRSSINKNLPVANLNLNQSKAVLYCAAVTLMLPFISNAQYFIPPQYLSGISAILTLLKNQVLVCIGILGWIVYSGRGKKWHRLWLFGLVGLSIFYGLTSGMLELALVPIGVIFTTKWFYSRRIPVFSLVIAILLAMFFYPVKSDYRQSVWFGDDPELARGSSTQKVKLWVDQATEYWGGTLKGERSLAEATEGASLRTDLIHQFAYIYSMTPNAIPYQYGKTYSYFAVSLIPRVLWPDKPPSGNANRYYAVTYGITSEEGAEVSTFGVSLIGESYINFGWPGILLIMVLQGVIISMLQHSFGEKESGAGGQAVFLAFFIFFLNGIGSSAEMLFGNIVQNLLCGCLLLLWARERAKPSSNVNSSYYAGVAIRNGSGASV